MLRPPNRLTDRVREAQEARDAEAAAEQFVELFLLALGIPEVQEAVRGLLLTPTRAPSVDQTVTSRGVPRRRGR